MASHPLQSAGEGRSEDSSRGRQRPDLPAGCPEQFDVKLLRWVWNFPIKQRPQIVAGIDRFGGHLRVVRIESDRAGEDFLALVKAA